VSDVHPDPDERFSLYPLTGEEALKKLLDADEDKPEEGDDSE
jgi:hypothetical protein